jgi:DNA helicase II / ATP-dependent DNA helicase PcrA
LFYVGMTRAQVRLFLSCASRRRVFGEYRSAEPSRFLGEIPDELLQRHDFAASAYRNSPYGAGAHVDPYARRPHGGDSRSWGGDAARYTRTSSRQIREAEPSYAYEDEDQSNSALRLGMRVRHPQFGIGTVLGIEGEGESLKLTVRFASAGAKKLLARYARLERA